MAFKAEIRVELKKGILAAFLLACAMQVSSQKTREKTLPFGEELAALASPGNW